MPRGKHDRLYIGIKGHVVAIDRATGLEAWRAKLKGGGFVTLHREDRTLYAGTSGELYCIDADSGRILWHNPLKGMGLGLMAILGSVATPEVSTQYVSVAEHLRRQSHASSA
ncbi:MAG TPA: PQQ-binding-like beta-propeller repeat protein [Gemmatimonadaceae bacterium]|nr:PQQ-binding-like beta-propeller repeat protein [Gemmatimonadaceae bacterium]